MNDQTQPNETEGMGAASELSAGLERQMIRADEIRTLAPPRAGQAKMMTATWGPDIRLCEVGHWYSPEAVAEMIAAEREACAAIADARAMRCEAKTADADDAGEVTELRSLAWQFSVLAAEMRKRSNVKVTGAARHEQEQER